MTSEKSDNLKNEGDAWQELAEDLFGIDLGVKHAGDSVLSDADEDLDRFVIEDEPVAEPPFADAEVPSDDAGSDFDAEVEPEGGELLPSTESTRPSAETQDEDNDPYWDALHEWSWDEDTSATSEPSDAGTATTSPPPSGKSAVRAGVARPVVKEPILPPRQRSDAFVDNKGFGVGILDDDEFRPDVVAPPESKRRQDRPSISTPVRGDATSSSSRAGVTPVGPDEGAVAGADTEVREAAELEPADDETEPVEGATPATAEARRRGGRRRRRRTRTQAAETVATVAEPVEERVSPEGKAGEEEVRRRRRRRLRRRREEGDAETTVAAEPIPYGDSNAIEADEPMASEHDSDQDATEPAAPNKYANVPSWEEAISYLLGRRSSAPESAERPNRSGER